MRDPARVTARSLFIVAALVVPDQPAGHASARRSSRAPHTADHSASALRARLRLVQGVPPSTGRGPASPGRRWPWRRAADPPAFPVLKLREPAYRFRLHISGRDRGAAVAGRSSGSADDLHLIRRQVVRRVTGHAAPASRLVPLRPPTPSEAGSAPGALRWPLLSLRPTRLPLKVSWGDRAATY